MEKLNYLPCLHSEYVFGQIYCSFAGSFTYYDLVYSRKGGISCFQFFSYCLFLCHF
jgi:hypothetical protein